MELVPAGADSWRMAEAPAALESGRTTVLHYVGGGFFAEVNRLEEEWPEAGGTRNAAVVLSLRGWSGIPSATFLKALERTSLRLRDRGVYLVLCGVTPRARDLLERTGALDVIGRDAVVVETGVLLESVTLAYVVAERHRTAGRDPSGSPEP